ncbi:MAG: double-strand break repair protein AddB, partial [Alphaproteobacteria bacterium]
MLLEGGFPDLAVSRIGELVYVSVTGRKPAGKASIVLEDEPIEGEVAKAYAGLKALVAAYDNPAMPYRSRTAPQFVKTYDSDYDHLARVYEWASAADDDGGGE